MKQYRKLQIQTLGHNQKRNLRLPQQVAQLVNTTSYLLEIITLALILRYIISKSSLKGSTFHLKCCLQGSWNFDYTQKSWKCPTCSIQNKCGPYCWTAIADPLNMCGAKSQTPVNIVTKMAPSNPLLAIPTFFGEYTT